MADSAVDPASQGLAVHEELFVPGGRIIGRPENFSGKIAEICQIAEKEAFTVGWSTGCRSYVRQNVAVTGCRSYVRQNVAVTQSGSPRSGERKLRAMNNPG